ncbi:hypothetical protein [Sphingomonas sp. T9W2]|uniref:hypothetical protein n=1 Tax=Sphingomonas sp. T9W2 TaxID=3143183 RepID=UPI0031F54298
MKYEKNIDRFAEIEVFPIERIVRRAGRDRLQPRTTLLFWLAIAVVPWIVIVALALRRG